MAKPVVTPREVKILRTQQKIMSTFFELLNEKPLDNISVVDICNRAKINRGTFYMHFMDKHSLLLASIEKIIKSFSLTDVANFSLDNISDYYISVVDEIVVFLTKWRTEIKAMVVNSDNYAILNTINQVTLADIKNIMYRLKEAGRPVPVSIDLSSEFLVGGFIALAKKMDTYRQLH